ncbi:MAG TPA: methyl-accepting chemotaxis protein, partial [Clostridia bacterium]
MNIRKKVTLTIITLIVFSIVLLGTFAYFESGRNMKEEISVSMLSTVIAEKDSITAQIEKEEAATGYLATDENIGNFLTSSSTDTQLMVKVNKILADFKNNKKQYEHIFLVDEKGIIVADTDSKLIGKDINNRGYTKKTLSTKEPQISETIKSLSTGGMIIAFTYPVINTKTGNLSGFVATSVFTEALAKNIKDMKVNSSKSSYAYLVDETGKLIYHPTAEKIGKPVENEQIKAVIIKMQKGEKIEPAVVNYKFDGKDKLASYVLIPGTNWTLVLTGDLEEILYPVHKMTLYIIFIGLASILIASILAFITAKRISSPIVKVTELINQTAKLNLVYDKSFELLLKSKDETGTITKAIAEMRQSLREIVKLLRKSSQDIYINAEKVENVTEKVHENSNGNSVTTQQLSAAMEETAASAEEISASIDQVGSNVEEIADKTKKGTDLSVEITERADRLKKDAVASRENASKVYADVKRKMEHALQRSKAVEQVNVLANAI